MLVIDDQFQGGHVAFKDNATAGRVTNALGYDPVLNTWSYSPDYTYTPDFAPGNPDACDFYSVSLGGCFPGGTPDHGTKVLGQLAGDLFDNQDIVGSAGLEAERSGMAPEVGIRLLETKRAPYSTTVDMATSVMLADVVSRSQSEKVFTNHDPPDDIWAMDWGCVYGSSDIDAITEYVRTDDVFWVNTPGNESHQQLFDIAQNAFFSPCTTALPATAAAVFAVNPAQGVANTAPDGSDVTGAASRGDNAPGDYITNENSLISLVAPGGRDDPGTLPLANGGWGDVGAASSFAAPVVAGAAINLKDYLVNNPSFGPIANDPGYLFALMLLLGDSRQERTGANPFTFTSVGALDSVWGAGMLKMRLFNGSGMDAPARMRLCVFTVEEGDEVYCRLNPDDFGVNQPVPTTVDILRASAWWLEEDLDPSSGTQARINFGWRHQHPSTGSYITQFVNNLDHKKHIRVARDGTAWTDESIRIRADDIPARSWDGPTPTRTVYVAVFWEDEARDDANGPNDCVDHVCP